MQRSNTRRRKNISTAATSTPGKDQRRTRRGMDFDQYVVHTPPVKSKVILKLNEKEGDDREDEYVMKTSLSNYSLSSYRIPDVIVHEKKGILKNGSTNNNKPKDHDFIPSSSAQAKRPSTSCRSSPLFSFFLFTVLITSFLILLLIGIDQLGFPTLIEACYKFPDGVKDPCVDLDCQFGSECIRSRDGKKAECVCPEKCFTYGDSVGSRPVCGSDGRDYPNDCELRRRACSFNITIEPRFSGRCDPCDSIDCPVNQVCQLDDNRNPICRCNAICNLDFKPICASDGETTDILVLLAFQ